MTSQLIVRLDAGVKDRFQKLAKREGKTASQIVRTLIDHSVAFL